MTPRRALPGKRMNHRSSDTTSRTQSPRSPKSPVSPNAESKRRDELNLPVGCSDFVVNVIDEIKSTPFSLTCSERRFLVDSINRLERDLRWERNEKLRAMERLESAENELSWVRIQLDSWRHDAYVLARENLLLKRKLSLPDLEEVHKLGAKLERKAIALELGQEDKVGKEEEEEKDKDNEKQDPVFNEKYAFIFDEEENDKVEPDDGSVSIEGPR